MLSDNELKEILAKIIKANNEEEEGAAIKILRDVIQKEKNETTNFCYKMMIASFNEAIASHQKF